MEEKELQQIVKAVAAMMEAMEYAEEQELSDDKACAVIHYLDKLGYDVTPKKR